MRYGFDKALNFVLVHEGGFVNHPRDPGGITNLGVTKRAWEAYLKRSVDEAEMRALTPAEVEPFYRSRYWDATYCDDLDDGVDLCVFDAAVNMGPAQSIRILQRSMGLPVDGLMGKKTITAACDIPSNGLIFDFCFERRAAYKKISNFNVFGKGWLARVDECEREAYKMLNDKVLA